MGVYPIVVKGLPVSEDPDERVDTRMRIPRDLYKRIKALATAERRSINAEVIVLLEIAVKRKEKEISEGNSRRAMLAI